MWVSNPAARRSAAERDRRLGERRHAVQVADALGDLLGREARDPLGAELLDVVRGERGAVGHRAAELVVAPAAPPRGGGGAEDAPAQAGGAGRGGGGGRGGSGRRE